MSQQRNQKNQLIRLNADKDLTAAAAEGRVPEQQYHSIFMKGSSPDCGIEPSFWVEAFGSGFEVYYSGYLDGFA